LRPSKRSATPISFNSTVLPVERRAYDLRQQPTEKSGRSNSSWGPATLVGLSSTTAQQGVDLLRITRIVTKTGLRCAWGVFDDDQ
jgi:hypothetical protein